MRSAVVIVSLIAAIAAEAPYHLPRPGPQAPSFQYPQPNLRPHPPPPRPYVPPPQPAPQPLPNFIPGSGYNYQQPSIQPAFVQPQPQFQPQPLPAPLPQPQFHPQPQPFYQSQPQFQPQPLPQPQSQQYPGYHYHAPAPAPGPAPQPFPVNYPQLQPQPQPQPLNFPSTSYGVPQFQPQIAPRPISQPSFIPPQPRPQFQQPQIQPQPLPQIIQISQPNQYQQQQQSAQQGYSYPQPLAQSVQTNLPLQSQGFNNNIGSSSLSSYQADNNQYSGAQAQTHREALDSLVVGRVQNIIKENEHSVARDAGYLSLVSGVSLENAKPSIEISSFVHTAPAEGQSIGLSSSQGSSSSGADSGAISAPSSDYGLPAISDNSQSSQSGSSIGFLPNSKPAVSYGPPN